MAIFTLCLWAHLLVLFAHSHLLFPVPASVRGRGGQELPPVCVICSASPASPPAPSGAEEESVIPLLVIVSLNVSTTVPTGTPVWVICSRSSPPAASSASGSPTHLLLEDFDKVKSWSSSWNYFVFLAVHNSSIGDLVTHSLT